MCQCLSFCVGLCVFELLLLYVCLYVFFLLQMHDRLCDCDCVGIFICDFNCFPYFCVSLCLCVDLCLCFVCLNPCLYDHVFADCVCMFVFMLMLMFDLFSEGVYVCVCVVGFLCVCDCIFVFVFMSVCLYL